MKPMLDWGRWEFTSEIFDRFCWDGSWSSLRWWM